MSKNRFREEFKIEAVKQVTERNRPVTEVAARLGVSGYSLYEWIKRYSVSPAECAVAADQQSEMGRLKAELKQVTEERDILEGAAMYFAKMSRRGAHSSDSLRRSIGAAPLQSFDGAAERLGCLVPASRLGTRAR